MKKLNTVLFFLMVFVSINAQGNNPIKWNYAVNKTGDCEAELVFTANVDNGWHLYGQKHINGLPLTFEFIPSETYKRIGEVTEPDCHKEYDDIMQYDIFYFKEQVVVFKQKITLSSNTSFKITGHIGGQACQEDGVCIRLNHDFTFDIDIAGVECASIHTK